MQDRLVRVSQVGLGCPGPLDQLYGALAAEGGQESQCHEPLKGCQPFLCSEGQN